MYVGVDGVAKRVVKMYVGVDGIAREVTGGYIGVDGVAKKFFDGHEPPPVIDPVLSYNSWAAISYAARHDIVPATWAIGDLTAPFNTIIPSNITYYCQLIGKKHDNVTNPLEYGQAKAGLTFQLGVSAGGTRRGVYHSPVSFNTTNTNIGGWPGSNLRNTLLPTIEVNTLPQELREVIVPVNKYSGSGGVFTGAVILESSDRLFPFSEVEIRAKTASTLDGEGERYEFYLASGRIVRTNGGSNVGWVTRSPRNSVSELAANSASGGAAVGSANSNSNYAFAFCL